MRQRIKKGKKGKKGKKEKKKEKMEAKLINSPSQGTPQNFPD